MSIVSPSLAYYASPADQAPVQPYQPVNDALRQPLVPVAVQNNRPVHSDHHNTSVMTEYTRLNRRWFPKQIFNTKAPPEDQIAGAGRMALMAGLLGFCMPPFVAGVPLAIVTYLWQTQRNQDALNNLYKQQAEKEKVANSPKRTNP